MRCPNHTDRVAAARCGVCAVHHCSECAPHEASLHEPVCQGCRATLPPTPASRPRPRPAARWPAILALVGVFALAASALISRSARDPLVDAFGALEEVGLALEEFRAQTGDYPDSLQDLVPAVLDALPADPFDPQGGQLRYGRAEGAVVLYSLGPDRLDQRGVPRDPSTGAGDLPLVVR